MKRTPKAPAALDITAPVLYFAHHQTFAKDCPHLCNLYGTVCVCESVSALLAVWSVPFRCSLSLPGPLDFCPSVCFSSGGLDIP